MTPDLRGSAGPLRIAACALFGAIGYSSYAALPLMLGFFGQYLGVGQAALGWVGSAEMLGLLLGSLLTARALGRIPVTAMLLGGLALAIAANGVTLIATDVALLVACRLFAGIGGGLCYAYATTLLATTGNPERNFGWFMIASVLQAAILFMGMPWLAGHHGFAGPLAMMAGWLVVGVPLALCLPAPDAVGRDAGSIAGPPARRSIGVVALGAAVLFGVVLTALWSLIERIAAASTIDLVTTGLILNVANLACVLPSLIAAWLTARWSARLAATVALVTCIAVLTTWPVGREAVTGYSVRTVLIFMGLTLAQIQMFAIFGRSDPSGRQAALAPAALGGGQALGPIVGATAFGIGGFAGSLWTGAGLLALVAIAYVWAYGALDRARL